MKKRIEVVSLGGSMRDKMARHEELAKTRNERLNFIGLAFSPSKKRSRICVAKKNFCLAFNIPIVREVRYYVINPFTKKKMYIDIDELSIWKSGGADVKEELQ